MSAFLTPLVVDENEDDSGAVLTQDFVYSSDHLGRLVTVPAGFKTDYASVPRLPFAYLLFGGRAQWAAVIHDYLYRTASVPRADADATFLEAMTVSNLPAWQRYPMWAAVRAFGWTAYPDTSKGNVDEDHPAPPASGS